MAYERQYHTNGDVLEASHLNHMEAGIKENSDSVSKLSEEIEEEESVINALKREIFENVLQRGNQLYNPNKATLNGYWNASGGWSTNADFSTQKICPIKADVDIYTYRAFTYSAFFDENGKWIESNINSAVGSVIHTPSNAYTMYIGTTTSIAGTLLATYNPYFYIWNHDESYTSDKIEGLTSYDYYNLPFIKKGKLCCNKDSEEVTATYLGVDVKEKTNLIRSKFIFENYNINSGTVAMILLGSGCNKIQNIVDLSLHCVITNTHIKVDVLGKKFGSQTYQNIIDVDLESSLVMDGETEHDAYMYVSNNTVYVNVNGVNYSGTFTPTSDITSLDEVIGNYAVLEHYCGGVRSSFNMPQFTLFMLKNDSEVILKDTFERQDGVPQVSPQGHLYSTYSYSNNIG